MSEEPIDSLYAAVLANPLSNAARRAWCEDADPTRARFARLQLRHLELCQEGKSRSSEAVELSLEIGRLLALNEDAWRPDWPEMIDVYFHRGLPEAVRLTGADYLEHGERLFLEAPILHMLLLDTRWIWDELIATAWFDRLKSISLPNAGIDDDLLRALIETPFFRELVWIDLSGNKITDVGLEALAAADLPHLQWLGFADNVAPDPTPQMWIDNTEVVYIGSAGDGAGLAARHGPKPWLGSPRFQETRSPSPDWFYPLEDLECSAK